jgi:hypothetical protein
VSVDEFLLARIAEDEEVARALLEPYAWGYSTFWEASSTELDHIARHDPARVLADCAAKRAIVELHTGGHECSITGDHCRYIHEFETCDTLRLLAAPFAPHPDFRDEWTPRDLDTPTST